MGVCDCHWPGFANVLTRVQQNILLDDTGNAQIVDYGLTPITQSPDPTRSSSRDQGYAVRWTAPEILAGTGTYSKEADMFSFAMVMIEVLCEYMCRPLAYCRLVLLQSF